MDRFQFDQYLIRRKILKLFGASFHIFAGEEHLILYANLKAFKLKEDIRLYTGEDMTEEVLLIKARNIIDLGGTYDIYDSETNEKIGALKRKGMKSILKDEWLFLDKNDQEIGTIKEDNMAMALVRRFIINVIPQHYTAEINGVAVCNYRQSANPFVTKVKVEYTKQAEGLLDKRIGIAAGLLLCAVEGKQN
ncbi:MAG TPA: hypothetical protein VEF53_00795 [Patescibacteria group bacterium]|nr:hypothetical protein [Patescibacteria group bacterium]